MSESVPSLNDSCLQALSEPFSCRESLRSVLVDYAPCVLEEQSLMGSDSNSIIYQLYEAKKEVNCFVLQFHHL